MQRNRTLFLQSNERAEDDREDGDAVHFSVCCAYLGVCILICGLCSQGQGGGEHAAAPGPQATAAICARIAARLMASRGKLFAARAPPGSDCAWAYHDS